jgi:acetolactate synthase-1/2/3 large subunit
VTNRTYTTSTAFLEALAEAGVRYLFANLGSDHPDIIEALAQARADGREGEFPQLVVCPHETVALSAAHAYAAVSGRPQAVLVHVDSGTQNLGGAVNNASRGRVPVLIFAGTAPATIEGELRGSRNEFIHWLQDVPDQRGILRNYVKYDNELRTGRNVKQVVHRALQIAASEPAGPVYLVAAREVMAEELEQRAADPALYSPVAPAALAGDVVAEIAGALAGARHPLIITSYLGRDPAAVPVLTGLAERLAIPVIESVPSHVSFPASHPLHCGYQWTTAGQNPLLAQADVVLAVDSDVPWIHATSRPAADAVIYCIDADPLKAGMPMWHVPARRFAAANSRIALGQLAGFLARGAAPGGGPADRAVAGAVVIDEAAVAARRAEITAYHDRQRAAWAAAEEPPGDAITPAYLVACVRELLAGEDALVLSEAITNYLTVNEHLRPDRPGSLLASGGGSLGWAGGGAVGAKLAAPGRTVACLVGDGSYLFGVPSAAQWVARRYQAPALTVIFNNGGWQAPESSLLAVHPQGAAAAAGNFYGSFEPVADLAGIARAAGGAHGAPVSDPAQLPGALKEALAAVHAGRSAVLDVRVTSR